MKELKQIPEFPGYYASRSGFIYSTRQSKDGSKKKLKQSACSNGNYALVSLRKNGKTHSLMVHRLICITFNGNPPKNKSNITVSHKDGDSSNNRADNLVWETVKENLARKKDHGTSDGGWRNSRAMFTEDQVRAIRKALDMGLTAKFISEMLGCNERLIGKIKRYERYKE
jgi:hypothetical protein